MKQAKKKKRRTPITLVVLLVLLAVVSVELIRVYGQLDSAKSQREAMSQELEQQKKELDAAIQAEHVKATLFEDEASIGTFYQRFAHATMDTPQTRDLLFEYFVDKIFVGATTLTIASWFFDHGAEFTLADLDEMKETGEVLNVEFNTSPRGGPP